MEGPSLVILTEELVEFKGKKIIAVSGNSKQDIHRLQGKKILGFKSWGKHFLIVFKEFTLKIHFLLFGSYRINEEKENRTPRLSLEFMIGKINFYACSVQFIEEDLESIYDWKVDLMSSQWDKKTVIGKLLKKEKLMVCDVLLDQDVFAGSGNIIKNEVLFNLQWHPETLVGNLKKKELEKLALETRDYSFRFYEWKKIYELRKHWRIYKKRKCTRCAVPIEYKKTGKGQRGSYFCSLCQNLII